MNRDKPRKLNLPKKLMICVYKLFYLGKILKNFIKFCLLKAK